MLDITKLISAFFLAVIIWSLTPAETYAQFSEGAPEYNVTEDVFDDSSLLREFSFTEPLTAPLVYDFINTFADQKPGYDYSGMSVYLGQSLPVKILESGRVKVIKSKEGETVLSDGEWTGFKGRFQAGLVYSETGEITVTKDKVSVAWSAGIIPDLKILTGPADGEATLQNNVADLKDLKYVHLPRILRVLCRFVEWVYKGIQSVTGLSWGLSLFLFAVVIKALLFPINVMTARLQGQANAHKAALEPIFNTIKEKYKGETAHKKVMAAYKARGITPYYSLKPLLATMISLPVLIAIFNMLGEILPLRDSAFLWIESLAYPDKIAALPLSLPLLGQSLNLLPFLMTGVTFLSAYSLKSATASAGELRRQKRNLYLMGTAFFLIFYPFPSAMVLYWTLSTALQFVINRVSKVT
ncbi:membrane protein insertase YidC [Hellea sp.]|nr:membrane protein insertase YidC [Hellea sp.]